MDKKIKVVIFILSFILAGHLLRLIFRVPVMIGSFNVPLYLSLFPVIFLICLIIWLVKK